MKARILMIALVGVPLVASFVGVTIAQPDKYALNLGKLSFGDFRGYENWPVVAASREDNILKVILANNVMIEAYKQGLPVDGKTFPEGSKVVKIEWTLKKNPQSPYAVDVPDQLRTVGTIEKDSKRFPDTHGWAYGAFNYTPASKTFTPQGSDAKCGYACHTRVASQDYIFTAYPPR